MSHSRFCVVLPHHHDPEPSNAVAVNASPAPAPNPVHTHGVVDASIIRSRSGLKAVGVSLVVLMATAGFQAVVFVASGSVALLADVIHNFGDAFTAVPLAIAFVLRSSRAERVAGYAVFAAIAISAAVAFIEAIDRFIHPGHLQHAGVLALAGVVGVVGNEVAAQIRLRAGQRLSSPALIADGHHARIDGYVSFGVVVSAAAIYLGAPILDPIIGLAITVLIVQITHDVWRTIRADPASP